MAGTLDVTGMPEPSAARRSVVADLPPDSTNWDSAKLRGPCSPESQCDRWAAPHAQGSSSPTQCWTSPKGVSSPRNTFWRSERGRSGSSGVT
ncbi:hypothetical protein PMG11_00302 [Penicillium brasilianum]|uniref:Uncharacterized protein n=1 Tax=Penicillium brasilianum TaxID=104259 RepID=A0A0F7TDV4_PENBI|nr:hypothetical protein PMG11_00302 [Penicillium brasilianum]